MAETFKLSYWLKVLSPPIGSKFRAFLLAEHLETDLRRFISLAFVLTGVTILIFSAIGIIIYRNGIISSVEPWLRISENPRPRSSEFRAPMKMISFRVVVEQAVSDSWDEWFFNSGAIDDDSFLKSIISPGKAPNSFFISNKYESLKMSH